MKSSIAIIGGGPSALLLAAHIDPSLYRVTIYEQQKTVGRKFLVAGKGGFNLTHAESINDFINQYLPSHLLRPSIEAFTPSDLREWLAERGITTYVGSSGRVFPTPEIKPIEVLQSILDYLTTVGVTIKYQEQWIGWDDEGRLTFASGLSVDPTHRVFALGGGSWQITGSDGHWLSILGGEGILVSPFRAVNCGFSVAWDQAFVDKYAGHPIKNIEVSHDQVKSTGELTITDYGLEGNAIYAMSYSLQQSLLDCETTDLIIDLKPILSLAEIKDRLTTSPLSISQTLTKKIKLSNVKLALLKSTLNKEEYIDINTLAQNIKALPIQVSHPRSLDEAISTIGGVSPDALTGHYELKALPRHYCIGEMVDWFAPTGGYLLQGCFSMGVGLAGYFNGMASNS